MPGSLARMAAPKTGKPLADTARAALRALASVVGAAPSVTARPSSPPPADSAIIMIDDQGLIVFFDHGAEQLWGYPSSDAHQKSMATLIDSQPIAPNTSTRTTAHRPDGASVRVLVTRQDVAVGDRVLSLLHVRPEDGGSHAMASSELRYRSLVEQIPAVVFTAALDGGAHDLYVGPQIEALLGYTQEEWLRDPVLWYERLHPDDRRKLDAEFARGCATGGPFKAECRFLARDGKIVWVHGEARLIKDAGGWPLLLQGVAFDISETKQAEELVRASLREKELLLKEIHHRVKNNLQITSSLLRLQVARVADEQVRSVLLESQDRIRSMALVHEMLYRSTDLSRVNFAEYARALLLQLFRSYSVDAKRVSHVVDIQTVDLGVDFAVPCGLLLNELVANSLKHAFPEGRKGTLTITMNRVGPHYELSVRDDGIGFPAAIDFRRTQTLGLQLVRTLTDQLGGRIEMKVNGGTEFRVLFPTASQSP
jgi:PAS domain S-box-containing protein